MNFSRKTDDIIEEIFYFYKNLAPAGRQQLKKTDIFTNFNLNSKNANEVFKKLSEKGIKFKKIDKSVLEKQKKNIEKNSISSIKNNISENVFDVKELEDQLSNKVKEYVLGDARKYTIKNKQNLVSLSSEDEDFKF